jgi:hypothetical protein
MFPRQIKLKHLSKEYYASPSVQGRELSPWAKWEILSTDQWDTLDGQIFAADFRRGRIPSAGVAGMGMESRENLSPLKRRLVRDLSLRCGKSDGGTFKAGPEINLVKKEAQLMIYGSGSSLTKWSMVPERWGLIFCAMSSTEILCIARTIKKKKASVVSEDYCRMI